MKILLTGGHITPLLAIAEALKENTETSFLVVTRKVSLDGSDIESPESKILKEKNIPFVYLTTGKLARHASGAIFSNLLKMPYGFLQALKIVRSEKPAIVVSFGSYLSVPVCLAAWLCRIPIITHEQSVKAGLANRINSFFATKVAISFESSRAYFPKHKVILTGNPIRTAIFRTVASTPEIVTFLQRSNQKPLLYITGGSQGSHVINTCIFQALPELINICRVIHQTGDNQLGDYQNAIQAKKQLLPVDQENYLPIGFVGDSDIGAIYHTAQLILGRSGANTVTELAALNKRAIFIPLPFAQQDEQMRNAQWFIAQNDGKIIAQDQLNPEYLINNVQEMIENRASSDKIHVSMIESDATNKFMHLLSETAL